MSDFEHYMTTKADVREADAFYNYAACKLERAQIKNRLAKIKSQHEPIHEICNSDLDEREKLYAIAFYVVVGRLPSIKEEE